MAQPKLISYLPQSLQQRLHVRHNLVAILQNISWLMFDKILRLVIGLVISAWVARYLGPTQFGELAYVLAYIGFFQAVTTLGLDGILVRDISKNKENANVLLGTVFALRLIVGIICWLTAVGSMA